MGPLLPTFFCAPHRAQLMKVGRIAWVMSVLFAQGRPCPGSVSALAGVLAGSVPSAADSRSVQRLRPTLARDPGHAPVRALCMRAQYPLARGPRYLASWREHLVKSPGDPHLMRAAPAPCPQ